MAFISTFLEQARARRFRARHNDTLAIFNWHQVTPQFDPLWHHPYTWTSLEVFTRQLDELAQGYTILPLDEALSALDEGRLRGRCAALTFDDGDRSIADYVAPLLLKRGLPATFFINSAYLRGDRTYWFPILSYAAHVLPDALKQCGAALRLTADPDLYGRCRERIEDYAAAVPALGDRLVKVSWLARLDGAQFAIGAHGHEHQRYAMMPEEWQRNDLAANLKVLKDFSGFRPVFAAPFGRPIDVSPDVMRVARNAGLKTVLAAGGINTGAAAWHDRIPADIVTIKPALRRAMARAGRAASAGPS